MENTILTIGITSYNRLRELERCLESIKAGYQTGVEVLICEDKSPKREEIKNLVSDFCSRNPEMDIVFHPNEKNIGYDRNLKNIIDHAHGEWVMLMSDDDKFFPEAIKSTLDVIKENKPAMIYSPFYQTEFSQYRRKYDTSFGIESGSGYVSKHVYDGVLFSGLTFKKEFVKDLDAEPFLNKHYFQIYMFIYTLMNHGGYYMNVPTVEAVGDGENGYGKSESSEKNPLLADRTSIFSNLEFHKGLIWTIKRYDSDYGTYVFKDFEKEYNLRSYGGLSNARALGKETYKKYWEMLNSLDLNLGMLPKTYHFLLGVFGANFMNKLMSIPRVLLLRKRHANE